MAQRIDTSRTARALVGLSPCTEQPLPGWGRRPDGGPGWYVDARGDQAAVLQVLEGPGPRHGTPPRAGRRAPALAFRRDHAGEGEAAWLRSASLGGLAAVPDGDGRLLAHLLHRHPLAIPTADLSALVAASSSDPVFLVGAVACQPAPARHPTPVHHGQLSPRRVASLRVVQASHALVLEVARLLSDRGGRHHEWGGTAHEVAERVAKVMLARYPDQAAQVARESLIRAIDQHPLPIAPQVQTGSSQLDEVLHRDWATWAFGRQSSIAEGRSVIRQAIGPCSDVDVDRALVTATVALQLAIEQAQRPGRAGHTVQLARSS